MKQMYPTIKQANLMFLFISIAILLGSSILAPRLGIGTNTWINEYIWILAPAVLLVKLGKLPAKEVLKLQKASKNNILLGILSAICIWFFAFYLSKITGLFLDSNFGTFNTGTLGTVPSVNQSILLLIGMIILAPICEELLFRGVIQSAYEAHNKKYGFVMSAVLFGMFHVLNGITEVIPTFFVGLLLGFLVYRTRSIAASMFAHMAFNASAVFINGGLGLTFLKTIPMWLHVVSIGGAVFAVLLLSRVKPADQEPEVIEAPVVRKFSISNLVLLALSGLFVVLIAAIELYARKVL